MSQHLMLIPLFAGEPTIQLDITEFCISLQAGAVIQWSNDQACGLCPIPKNSRGYALIMKNL